MRKSVRSFLLLMLSILSGIKMNIVVTGAAGYIGGLLCRKLASLPNNRIYAFDNLMYGQPADFLNHARIKFFRQDINKFSDELVTAIVKADFIIPLAAIVGAPACEVRPHNSWKTNYEWFDLLLPYLKKQKIIYPNSNSGYGTSPPDTICDETSPSRPLSAYATLKQNTEDLLLKEYGTHTVCFRLATVLGRSYRQRLDLLFNNLVFLAHRDKHLSIYQPNARRNFISVNDVCRGFQFAMENFSKMRCNRFNLGTDEYNTTKGVLADMIAARTGCRLSEGEGDDPDKRDYLVSNEKIKSLGFEPEDTSFGPQIDEMYNFCSTLQNKKRHYMFNYDYC